MSWSCRTDRSTFPASSHGPLFHCFHWHVLFQLPRPSIQRLRAGNSGFLVFPRGWSRRCWWTAFFDMVLTTIATFVVDIVFAYFEFVRLSIVSRRLTWICLWCGLRPCFAIRLESEEEEGQHVPSWQDARVSPFWAQSSWRLLVWVRDWRSPRFFRRAYCVHLTLLPFTSCLRTTTSSATPSSYLPPGWTVCCLCSTHTVKTFLQRAHALDMIFSFNPSSARTACRGFVFQTAWNSNSVWTSQNNAVEPFPTTEPGCLRRASLKALQDFLPHRRARARVFLVK